MDTTLLTFVGPCFNCFTSTPSRLANAVVATELPAIGVVTVCMLCDGCLADPHSSTWDGWMRRASPPSEPIAGRLIVQTIGVCVSCMMTMAVESDLTGLSGRRVAPATCSAECEIEARRRLS